MPVPGWRRSHPQPPLASWRYASTESPCDPTHHHRPRIRPDLMPPSHPGTPHPSRRSNDPDPSKIRHPHDAPPLQTSRTCPGPRSAAPWPSQPTPRQAHSKVSIPPLLPMPQLANRRHPPGMPSPRVRRHRSSSTLPPWTHELFAFGFGPFRECNKIISDTQAILLFISDLLLFGSAVYYLP